MSDITDKLNTLVRLHLAPSKIHGVGVFALQDIPKDTKLYATMFPQGFTVESSDLGTLKPEVRECIIAHWPRTVDGEAFAYPDTFFQGYMNHSDTPNYDALTDISLRDIKAGEEITEDYRLVPNYQKAYPWLL